MTGGLRTRQMNLAESLSESACPPRFGTIPSPVPTGERSVPKECGSLQWQIPTYFPGLTIGGMQIHSTTRQLTNEFYNQSPRFHSCYRSPAVCLSQFLLLLGSSDMCKGRPETGLRSCLLPGRSIRLDPKKMDCDAGGDDRQQQPRPPQRNHEASRAADHGP